MLQLPIFDFSSVLTKIAILSILMKQIQYTLIQLLDNLSIFEGDWAYFVDFIELRCFLFVKVSSVWMTGQSEMFYFVEK